jgi:membrane protein
LLRSLVPTVRYLYRTEVHAFAFAIAASTLLSLFPFLHLMASLCFYVFKWRTALDALRFGIINIFGDDLGGLLESYIRYPYAISVFSVILLLFTANGVFEPLEVALNRAWGVTKDRSYFKNQMLSFLLIILCGSLVLASFLLTAANRDRLGAQVDQSIAQFITILTLRVTAVAMTTLALFLTYWLLPNCRVPVRRIAGVAFYVALALTGLQYIALFFWKWIISKLTADYGPFGHSSSVLLFTFVAALIVLAGAEWTARRPAEPQSSGAAIMSATDPAAKPVE